MAVGGLLLREQREKPLVKALEKDEECPPQCSNKAQEPVLVATRDDPRALRGLLQQGLECQQGGAMHQLACCFC